MPPVRSSQNPAIVPGDLLPVVQDGRARHVVVGAGVTPLMAAVGLAVLAGEGAPDDAVQASETIDPATADDNAILWTAVTAGAAGDDITVEYDGSGGPETDLAAEVEYDVEGGIAIKIILATGEESEPDAGDHEVTTTAADVIAAVEGGLGSFELVALHVVAEADPVDEDAGDSVGVLETVAATPLAGGAGTGIGAAPGSLYSDVEGPALYMNTGTDALPVWTLVGPAA